MARKRREFKIDFNGDLPIHQSILDHCTNAGHSWIIRFYEVAREGTLYTFEIRLGYDYRGIVIAAYGHCSAIHEYLRT